MNKAICEHFLCVQYIWMCAFFLRVGKVGKVTLLELNQLVVVVVPGVDFTAE